MEDIHAVLEVLENQTVRSVLATIVHVEGSAYRKEGTTMLVQEDGMQTGLLSGGCLEEDIHTRFEAVWTGGSSVITYDMRGFDDLSWGRGTGCDGIIQVLLEPVNSRLYHDLMKMKEHLNAGNAVLMVKQLPADSGSAATLFECTGSVFGNWNGTAPAWINAARSGMQNREDAEEEEALYVHLFSPKPRLFVFGAGDDTCPLVHLAAFAGFDVTVADWRPAKCSRRRFPDARNLFTGFPEDMKHELDIKRGDFAVVMTHDFKRDKELLAYLRKRQLSYLGVLGSRKRTSLLLDQSEVPGDVKTPVGFSIAAEGPHEIAVSITAELIERFKSLTSGSEGMMV
ncbi:XdhC family protein [Salibacterium qingdaonense]|uniref:Xanthine dehydrogenase molybdenum-binding subunit n=1 Tax=Salibacterium qingdaonense TaxID=266892 RepID=A0A1I4HW24_9BACI|nr:XdhC family protein [Salibacterium qingdaonense]SFL46338.1 xanthine dehydrogenase molybdenum-binding subunit [Salibacterium qingdaonense]